jgi:hypothetical protein
MKFKQDMLFGHPVLVSDGDDYIDGAFGINFQNPVVEGADLILTVEVQIACPDLRSLIDENRAECGFYIICENTFLNRFVPVREDSGEFRFPAGDFAGTVRLRGVIVSTQPVAGYESRVINPEFGERPYLPPASILAYDHESTFAVGQISKKPFESIFSLVASKEMEPGGIAVNPTESKIQICVHPKTKNSIDAFRTTEAGRTILLNSIYMPAVMQLLHEVSEDAEQYHNKPWFPVFEAKCTVLGVSLENPKPLEDAQKLLLNPFYSLESETIKERLLS